MKPLGISRNRLARDIDIPVSRVSEIVRGVRGITADTALRLGAYFGTSAEMWMNLQSGYDLRVARTTTWPEAKARVRALPAA
jgi:addiction module HigA family antidote